MRSQFGTPMSVHARSNQMLFGPLLLPQARMPYSTTKAWPNGGRHYDMGIKRAPPLVHLGGASGDSSRDSSGARHLRRGDPGPDGVDWRDIDGWGVPSGGSGRRGAGSTFGVPSGGSGRRRAPSAFGSDVPDPVPRPDRALSGPGWGVPRGDRVTFGAEREATANRATEAENRAEKRADPEAGTDYRALLQHYGPAAAAVVQQAMATDPRASAKIYDAKVANLRRMARNAPPFLRPVWKRRLRVMRAKRDAARESEALQREGEQATRQWRGLGFAATTVGIVAGVAFTALLLASATAVARGPR